MTGEQGVGSHTPCSAHPVPAGVAVHRGRSLLRRWLLLGIATVGFGLAALTVAVAIGAIVGITWVDFWCPRRLHSGRPHGSYRVHQQYVADGPSRRTASGEFPAAHR